MGPSLGRFEEFQLSTPANCLNFNKYWSEPVSSKISTIDKRGSISEHERKETQPKELMLWTIFVILLILWLLGLVSSYTLGGFIHILLVIAVVILIINLIQGRRTL